jgi:hypothetical protein
MQKNHPPTDFKVMVGMMIILTLPFILTLRTVSEPRALLDYNTNPTPLGYTWSLSLFIIPVIVLALWLSRRRQNRIQNMAFWLTTLIVSLTGIALDTFLGANFFSFPNTGAVLGIHFPGWSFSKGFSNPIPIEEIGFYVFGILAVMLVYVWGDEFWLGAYNADDTTRREKRWSDIISFHPASAIFGVVIFFLGWFCKKHVPGFEHEGFPGYFLFLTVVAMGPSMVFFPVARPYINWRAFSVALLFILLVSLFWEATIAVPYQWWRFYPAQMLGLNINGFSGLPVEEPMLWMGVTWATVIMYEMISTVLFMEGARGSKPAGQRAED